MTARVYYLNTFYWPDVEEMYELDKMQEMLTYSHNQFEYDCRGMDPVLVRIKKDKVHRHARSKLTVTKAPISEGPDS